MKIIFRFMIIFGTLLSMTQYGMAENYSDISKLNYGIYLRVDYIDSLKKYRSPKMATKGKELLGVTIERMENDKKDAMLILNFHEGIRLSELDIKSRLKVKIKINSPTSLTINNPYNKKERNIKFVWIADGDNYEQPISFLVLGGSYRDKNGNNYEFLKDGNAIFPQGTSSYQVLIDFVGPPGYNNVKLGEREYFYEFYSNTLQLFRVHFDYYKGEEIKPRESVPSFVLQKID